MTDEKRNLFQRLIAVRAGVKYLQKENENRAQDFSYVSSSQVLASVREGMNENGIMIIPTLDESEVRDHRTANGGHQYMTILTIRYIVVNADNPEDKIETVWTGHGLDSGEKGPGKALTYGEKYLFLKLFNIPTDKDDPDSFGVPEPRINYATQSQIDQMKALAEGLMPGLTREELVGKIAAFGKNFVPGTPQDWTTADADIVIEKLNKKIELNTERLEGSNEKTGE